jgi:lipid A ethanolaminephosphotransferase
MFSFLGRENYSPEKAGAESNVLDVLQRAGVKVLWLDNNSSCKGVCERVENINLRTAPDEKHEFYSDGGYYDEAMLDYLADAVKGSQDVLIVLHTLGSHGPTYHKRFPAAFAQFKPYCQQDTPQACGDQDVINAYDNTLLYTDYVLERFITWLKQQTAQDDTFLLYASDHGESLGETGVYLHGLPYFIAPAAQTHIPMLLWLSDGYLQHNPTAWSTAQGKVDQPLSHDNLSHTLLGMFGVQTTLYQPQLDLLR